MSNEDQNNSDYFTQVLRRILTPLVGLLIRRGITLPDLVELLKRVYVEVAEKDFKLSDDKPLSDSRIHLITKVHRKDVKRLRQLPQSDNPSSPGTLAAQVASYWQANPDYLDEHGAPKQLDRYGSEECLFSFESLVRDINKEIRPKVALDELMHKSVVYLNGEGQVCLDQEKLIPNTDEQESLSHFSRNLHDHLAAAEHNLNPDNTQSPFLERSVYYKGLSDHSVEALSELAKQQGMDALLSVNSEAFTLQQQDEKAQASQTNKRMTFGIYFYATDEDKS